MNRPGAFAEFIALPMTNIWRHAPSINQEVAAIFDPFGMPSTPRFPFRCWAKMCSSRAPAQSASWPFRWCGTQETRHVVITDVNPFRLELARKMGATLAIDPRQTSVAQVQKQLGMQEGFDAGLEMSGNAQALRDTIVGLGRCCSVRTVRGRGVNTSSGRGPFIPAGAGPGNRDGGGRGLPARCLQWTNSQDLRARRTLRSRRGHSFCIVFID